MEEVRRGWSGWTPVSTLITGSLPAISLEIWASEPDKDTSSSLAILSVSLYILIPSNQSLYTLPLSSFCSHLLISPLCAPSHTTAHLFYHHSLSSCLLFFFSFLSSTVCSFLSIFLCFPFLPLPLLSPPFYFHSFSFLHFPLISTVLSSPTLFRSFNFPFLSSSFLFYTYIYVPQSITLLS